MASEGQLTRREALRIIDDFGSWLHHAQNHAMDSCGCIPPGHHNGCEVDMLLRVGEAWSAIYQGIEPESGIPYKLLDQIEIKPLDPHELDTPSEFHMRLYLNFLGDNERSGGDGG